MQTNKKSLITALICAAVALCVSLPSFAGDKYRLQPTDVLKITVHEQPDLETRARITQDGFITFPLIGKVYVKGMTVQELEYHLKQLLEKDYLVNAQVLCFIEEYHPRQVSVIGEVNSPGKFELPEEKTMTLLEAIALAGGFTKDAKLETVKIMRVNQGQKETLTINVKDITDRGQKEDDVTLQPDDIIVVPESFF